MKKLLSVILAVILVMSAFTGCSSSKGKDKTAASKASEADQVKTDTNTNPPADNAANNEESSKTTNSKVFKAVLYFPDKQAMGVIKEERDIPIDSDTIDAAGKAKLCIEELVKGSNKGLSNSIPKTTKVVSVKLDNSTLIVDLSRDFEKDHNGGSAGVLMTMSQLVLSLTEIEGVKQVSFKIEGRTLEEFKGSIEFNKPFARSEYEQYITK